VGVHVDVPRGHHALFGGYGVLAQVGINFPDTDNLSVLNGNIAVEPGIPCAVDNFAAVNYDVVE
jgi:hypothetical protein